VAALNVVLGIIASLLIAGPATALGEPGPLAMVSPTSALPFQYVNIHGTFSTEGSTTIAFAFGKHVVNVDPILVSPEVIRVAVPLRFKGSRLASGVAKVTVVHDDGRTEQVVEAGKLKIGKPKKVKKFPLGTLSKQFIGAASSVIEAAQARIAGTPIESPETLAALSASLQALDGIASSIDAALGLTAPEGASDYSIALSAGTVQQFDGYVAAWAAAAPLNTTDAAALLVYTDLHDAIQMPSKDEAEAQLKLQLAWLAYEELVAQNSQQLVQAINAVMAPTTATIASLTLTGLTTKNPAILLAAGQLALCAEVLNVGLIVGLYADAGYYSLTENDQMKLVYMNTAYSLLGDLLITKSLTTLAGAGGQLAEDLAGALLDLHGTGIGFGNPFQSKEQPQVAADLDPPHVVLSAAVIEGVGTVTLDPLGGLYLPGSLVTVTAFPGTGFELAGAPGSLKVSPTTYEVGKKEKTVTVAFEPIQAQDGTVTVIVVGPGTVTSPDDKINCPGGACSAKYPPSAFPFLQAQPDEGHFFVGWDMDTCFTETCPLVPGDFKNGLVITAFFQ